MFSAEILEKIFSDERTSKVPIAYQTTMIKVIEQILSEQKGEKKRATVDKSKLLSTSDNTDNALSVDTESYNGYQW